MMWKKSSLSVLFICMLVTMVIVVANMFTVYAATVVYVDPAKVASVTWTPGTQFTLDITVDDVADLFAWEVRLGWNATVLDLVNVTEGPFLTAQPGGTYFQVTRSEDIAQEPRLPEGFVIIACTTLGEFPGHVGSGVLATATFVVEAYGESLLDLYNTLLVDSTGYVATGLIPHSALDGYFVNQGVPEPEFFYSPSLIPVDEIVTFNASASYDTDGTIVSYAWDFGDGASLSETDPITTHTYTSVGTCTVNLTVTDDKGLTNTQLQTVKVRYHHDVAIISVSASSTDVDAGEAVTVNVTVGNMGTESETFDVTVYYGETALPSKTVSNLAGNTTQTLTFVWETTGVATGDYKIKAVASLVTGETYDENNTASGGDVGVLAAAEQSFPTTLVIGGVVAVAAIAGAGLFLFIRRKNSSAT